jgi:hypothetical protein
MVNQNALAQRIAAREGKKVEVNIAQIKEVMRCLFIEISSFSDKEVLSLINKIRKAQR